MPAEEEQPALWELRPRNQVKARSSPPPLALRSASSMQGWLKPIARSAFAVSSCSCSVLTVERMDEATRSSFGAARGHGGLASVDVWLARVDAWLPPCIGVWSSLVEFRPRTAVGGPNELIGCPRSLSDKQPCRGTSCPRHKCPSSSGRRARHRDRLTRRSLFVRDQYRKYPVTVH